MFVDFVYLTNSTRRQSINLLSLLNGEAQAEIERKATGGYKVIFFFKNTKMIVILKKLFSVKNQSSLLLSEESGTALGNSALQIRKCDVLNGGGENHTTPQIISKRQYK